MAYTPAELRARLNALPRVRLADLPTPLHPCPRFSAAVGGRVFLKRDDLTGLAFGGNKTRKFEFAFADALAEGADVVITGAASQSNHARQCAAAAAKLGLECYLVNRHDHRSRAGVNGNLLLDCLLGAQVRLVEVDRGLDQRQAMEQLAAELRAAGRRPYLMGARAQVLSVVAYVECVVEIVEQAAVQGVQVDTLVVASGNGTHAGVALGAKALGLTQPTLGFRPSPAPSDEAVAEGVAALANAGAEILGLETRLEGREIENCGAYVGEAYGLVTQEGLEAIQLLARTEGILLDPVYTGKAVAGLIDYLRTGRLAADQTVVYIHTGGTPALFAYAEELMAHTDNPPRVISDLAAGMR